MKRLGAVAALFVGSLLLTSCSFVPPNLEEFFDWREKFFLTMSFSDISELLGPLLLILIALALAVGLEALLANMWNEEPILSGGYITGLAIFGAIAMVYLYIPVAKMVGELFLDPNLTLDKVIESLRWSLSTNFRDLFLSGSGLFVTLFIPVISALWQVAMLIGAVIAIAISIVGHSLKGVFYAISQVIGWALFLYLYGVLVTLIGKYYPDWDYAPVAEVVNAFYLGATIVLMGACYIGFPALVSRLAPSTISTPESERRRLKFPLDKIITILTTPKETEKKPSGTPDTDGPLEGRRSEPPLLPPGSDGFGRRTRSGPPLLPPGPSGSGEYASKGSGGNEGVGFDTSEHEFTPGVIELGSAEGKESGERQSPNESFGASEPVGNFASASVTGFEKDNQSVPNIEDPESLGREHVLDISQPSSRTERNEPLISKSGTHDQPEEIYEEETGRLPIVSHPKSSVQDNTAWAQQDNGPDDDFVLEIS